MREFTTLHPDVEQTITMAEWHRHRDAEYQRVQKKKKKQTKGEQ
jgi:hypothetical protein